MQVILICFPSAAISYKLNDINNFALSYSRRIDRPNYDRLNPSLFEIDNRTFWKGNEYLRPQYSNNIELSHTFKNILTTSLTYTYIKDAMVQVTEQDEATARTYVIMRNLNNQKYYAINLYSNNNIFNWWQLNNNITIYYAGFNYTYDNNNYHGGQSSLTYNMNHSFNLTKTLIAEASVYYQSALTYGLDKIKSFSFIDAGLRQSFMEKNLLVKLSMNDIFNNRKIRGVTNYQGINLTFNQRRESQIGRISVSYNFGNAKLKAARQRKTAAEEESGRIKQ